MFIFSEQFAREMQQQKERSIAASLKSWEHRRLMGNTSPEIQVKLLLKAAEWLISTGSYLKDKAEKLSIQNRENVASYSKGSC